MKKILLSLLTIFLASAIYAQLDDQPLIVHLEFEDDADIAYNDQDLTYDDAEPTAEYTTDAMLGTGAAEFDGTQYIIFDVNEDIHCETKSYSWCMWVKTEAAGGSFVGWAPYTGTPAAGNGEFDENDPHDAGVHCLFWGFEDGMLGAPVFDVGWVDLFVAEAEINDGEWHHVAVTVDVESSAEVIYIDGVQSASGEIGPSDYPADEQGSDPATWVLKVGYVNSGWPADGPEENQLPYFTGTMDEFRMYGAVLSPEDVTELFELTSTSLERSETSQDFEVYPNPASEQIRIKSTSIRDLEIFNAVGQLVRSEKDIQDGSMINISNLEAGLYFVKSGESIQKLIIE